eukprot:CAMPEP_0194209722 /NCGR_PEP_ID=MMETSP0156-20130528/7738_1 /TAXON_ID=33649 /ORGANISM="Thalassionema nitzschioides, Strain L26-B" /LENGTH=550 /DNA_ID=CAMNT_0038936933 /DNA_START=136 /DNA_END=1789 /DNA_ORIENTATION=+
MPIQQQAAPKLRRKKKHTGAVNGPILTLLMMVIGILLLMGVGFLLEMTKQHSNRITTTAVSSSSSSLPHVSLLMNNKDGIPLLPIFAPIPNGKQRAAETLSGTPSMAGIVHILQTFLQKLRTSNLYLQQQGVKDDQQVLENFFRIAKQQLQPLENQYQGASIFPIRDDDSIFISLAAYRETLLSDTMEYAFSRAKHPEQLNVGAIVQNCFGTVREDGTIDSSGNPCKTGLEVVGKNTMGRDQTKISDAPPDPNGVADFCSKPQFRKYCESGQVRVLYVHASESLGPTMARYYASKLWNGETYFVQVDSHLQFAQDWDQKYIDELHATSNYPQSVLSSYPPGFSGHSSTATVRESPGARLCSCETRADDPNPIVRINTGVGYHGGEAKPTQIPFIAAGFFFARSEFLMDVPFDPYLPWCFMGEEIALSLRAWTSGWNIYAPRKNLISHQYRPGRLGLPKFWESVNQFWHKPSMNNLVQGKAIQRLKHMVGYPTASLQTIHAKGIDVILLDMEHYGVGKERTFQEYLEFANMQIDGERKLLSVRELIGAIRV